MQLRTLALVGLLCAAFVCVHASEPKPIRGIKSRDYHRYSQPQFVCFDQSATISSAQVNDDYCDCADGSDEPGTSACVNSRFWCANRGAKGQSLPSSRVNDGVCDCCDGTDELFSFSDVTCSNTCEDAGRAAKEALINEIAATEAGVTARAALLATAQQTISTKREKYAKYEKLMNERKVLLEAAKTKKETEEAVENEERTRRDAEKAAKDAAAAAAAEAAAAAAAAAPATDAAAPTTDAAAPAAVGADGLPVDPAIMFPPFPVPPDPYAEHHKIWAKHVAEMEQAEARAAFPADAKGKKLEVPAPKKEEKKEEEEKKENFPYPPEYAYQAADDQDKAKTEEKKENFPYPPEYAAPPAGGAAAPGSDDAHDEEDDYLEPEYEGGEEGEEEGDGEDDGEDDDDAAEHKQAEVDAPYVHPVQSKKNRKKSTRTGKSKTQTSTPAKTTPPPKPQAPVQDQTVSKSSINDLIAGAKADGPSLFEAIEQSNSGRFLTMKWWTTLMEDTVTTTVAITYSISLNLYYVFTGDFVWKDVSARWERNTLAFFEDFGNTVLYCVVSIERTLWGTETILESLLDADEIKKIKDEMWRKNVPKIIQPLATVPKDLYIHPAAEVARTEFSKIDKKVNRLQDKMDELKKSLDRDYGTDGQFAHMDGQCFELQVKQYTYEVCPYKSAAQKEGHSSTSLGSWSGIETAGDGTIHMKFTGGQTCWQGPARSLTVKLKCGAADALSNVEEPSKCVYEMQLQTPSVCNAQHAQVLRMNLEGGLIDEDEE